MERKIHHHIEFYKYLLKFHPVKYLGIAIMIIAPLFFIYRFLFLNSGKLELVFGSVGFFIMGLFVWFHGWDPYHHDLP